MEENTEKKEKYAVIDTETTWTNKLMSVGIAIAEKDSMKIIETAYYILTPEYHEGDLYTDRLFLDYSHPQIVSRKEAIEKINQRLKKHEIDSIYAYNARFDFNVLEELRNYRWFDILRIAAYKQYNRAIKENADCYKTGRLKHHYGVEAIMNLLVPSRHYHETHNAVFDAMDEQSIMVLLGVKLEDYSVAELTK